MNVLGQRPLDPPELLGVEAELDEVERLRGARELRIHGLVDRLPRRGEACLALARVHPLEKIREPAPGPVGEISLVDDVGLAGADRVLGRAASLFGVEPLVVVREHARDAPPLRLEPREVRELVLVPLVHEDPAVRVVEHRPRELAAHDPKLELRQVRAGEVVRQVGGREPKRAVVSESHHLQYQPTDRARLRRRARVVLHEQRSDGPSQPAVGRHER